MSALWKLRPGVNEEPETFAPETGLPSASTTRPVIFFPRSRTMAPRSVPFASRPTDTSFFWTSLNPSTEIVMFASPVGSFSSANSPAALTLISFSDRSTMRTKRFVFGSRKLRRTPTGALTAFWSASTSLPRRVAPFSSRISMPVTVAPARAGGISAVAGA